MTKITLAPGQADTMLPVAQHGTSSLTAIWLRAGEPHDVVDDDSGDDGIEDSLTRSLVTRGLCAYVEEPVATGGDLSQAATIIAEDRAEQEEATPPVVTEQAHPVIVGPPTGSEESPHSDLA